MPNNKNIEVVKELREKIAKAKSIIFTDLSGLKSNDANDFRAKLLENKAEMSVSKNSLLEVALKEEKKDVTAISKDLKGQTATIFAYEDQVSPVKAFFDMAKKFDFAKVKGGILFDKYSTAAEVESISKLPSRETLLSQVLYTLKSPISGFAIALGAIAKKKEVQQ